MSLAPVHFSPLKQMAQSPAHYKWGLEHPPEPTAAMRIGSAVHSVVLDPDSEETVLFDGVRRGKIWQEFYEANQGRLILNLSEHGEAMAMVNALFASPRAAELLTGAHEVRLAWSVGGRACAGRADCIGPRRVVELKTTSDANPDRFVWQARRMGYFAQLAWYMDGINRTDPGAKVDEAYIVAVESRPPFVVQTFRLTQDAIEFGAKQWRGWFERLRVCEESNEWPGYVQGDAPLHVEGEPELTMGGEPMEVE